jgi:hypothetical protein
MVRFSVVFLVWNAKLAAQSIFVGIWITAKKGPTFSDGQMRPLEIAIGRNLDIQIAI